MHGIGARLQKGEMAVFVQQKFHIHGARVIAAFADGNKEFMDIFQMRCQGFQIFFRQDRLAAVQGAAGKQHGFKLIREGVNDE